MESLMKKLFVLEDNPIRAEWFKKTFSNENDLIIVDNVQDAITHLSNNSPDILFLDHDLGGEAYVNSFNENTGYKLAEWIYKNEKSYKKIIIHSLNPVGVDNMFYMLTRKPSAKDVKKIPYIDLIHYGTGYLLR